MKRFLNYVWGGYLALMILVFLIGAIFIQLHATKHDWEISLGAFWGCIMGLSSATDYFTSWQKSLKKVKAKKYIFEYSVSIPADSEYEEKKLGTFTFDIPLDILPDFMAALKTANEYKASGVEPIAVLGIIEVKND
jgi:hypothetical protein